MNTRRNAMPQSSQEPQSARQRETSRERRPRDFGVGYGTSSGYASPNRRCYAESWARQPFSCW